MGLSRICTSILLSAVSAAAAPAITKVEPPNWWTPHTLNRLQVLLTGTDLAGAVVTTRSRGFKIEVRQISANGHYAFVYLDIAKDVQPGAHVFAVKTPSGTTEFTFRMERPLDPTGRFQGFSPDDAIYLMMPDRFANGDPANDNLPQYNSSVDRTNIRGFHGGDLKGIRDHLGYLKDLGVTAIWVTPITKNSAAGQNAGNAYHGYSASDFYDVEPHYGTLKELKELIDATHAAGMKFVLDQVVNHSGNRIVWSGDWPDTTWVHYEDRDPKPRIRFDIAGLADPYARPSRREPPLQGWFTPAMPDLNQEDPLVADYLIQNGLWWIGISGVDAFRMDTFPYVDRPFWEKYQTAILKQYPQFVVTGEITAPNPVALSFFEGGATRRGVDTKLNSILDFPLEGAVRGVFGEGQPLNKLTDLLAQDSLYLHPEMLVVFPGNHDQPRFLTAAKGDVAKLMMAEAFLLTTRRVVHLYYGDEIAMQGGRDPDNRRDFPGGWPSDPLNAFTPQGRSGDAAKVFDWTRALLHYRQAHPALRRGSLTQLVADTDRYAYLRSSPEEDVLVILNRAGNEKPIELPVDDLPLTDGLRLTSWVPSSPDAMVVRGKIVIEHPADVQIYSAKRAR
jgi:neopullulanase